VPELSRFYGIIIRMYVEAGDARLKTVRRADARSD
jgi:hypothetical protein